YFHGGEMEQTMSALARLGDDRAVDVFRKLLGPPTNWYVVEPLPQVLLELGSPKGVPLLEELIRRAERKEEHPYYNGPAELARAILPALQGNPKHVAKLLEHAAPSVRETAALYLAARGDLTALPVLIREAAGDGAQPAPGRRMGGTGQHGALRQAIVELGKPALPLLAQTFKETKDERTAMFC